MSAVMKSQSNAPALALDEKELLEVLQSSLYPGAAPESIKLVLGYCRASNLDPMQKPVHIVPMWDSKAGKLRDVVMPGIGLYRTQAARSEEYAGVSEPEYGDDVNEEIGGVEITYPRWCRVTVSRRLPTGEIVNFTAREFWKENYAVKGGKEKSIAPNAMWMKRPYGQLAKCAEAQALRKAFPEVGSQPTADEMEGKTLDANYTVVDQPTPSQKRLEKPAYEDAAIARNRKAWTDLIDSGRKSPADIVAMVETRASLTDAQRKTILALGTQQEPEHENA